MPGVAANEHTNRKAGIRTPLLMPEPCSSGYKPSFQVILLLILLIFSKRVPSPFKRVCLGALQRTCTHKILYGNKTVFNFLGSFQFIQQLYSTIVCVGGGEVCLRVYV